MHRSPPLGDMRPTGSSLPPGRFVELPGRGTTFVRELAGPPGAATLVLLHGWTATGALNWFSTFEALGQRFNVVCLDQRGHGRGIRSHRAFTLEDCADDAVALADSLSTGPVIAVGYSLGGPVAQLMWRRHPDRLAGVVLCATSTRFADVGRPPIASDHLAQALSFIPRELLAHAPRGALPRHDPVAIAQAGSALGRFDSRGWISEIDVPAAVVLTTRDRIVPPERQAELARATRATVHLVDGEHDVALAAPDRFVPALLTACDDVVQRARLGARR